MSGGKEGVAGSSAERGAEGAMPWRYVLALALPVLGAFCSAGLASRWNPIHLLLPFYPAVMLSAWLGGFGPGLLTTTLSALVINYYWLPPIRSLGITDSGDWVGFFLFLAVGLLVSSLSERTLRAQRRAEAAAADLRRQIEERAQVELATARLAQLADELRASAERYRLQLERHVGGVFRAHADGRLVDASDALAHMLGCPGRDDLPPGGAADFFARAHDWRELVATLTPGAIVSNAELEWKRRDGTTITVLVTARGAEGLVEAVAVDITDRKRAEQAEREAARLRAVADLAAAAAHEIYNPLTLILTTLSVPAPEAERSHRFARALEAAHRIRDIVARMARIEQLEMVEVASPSLPPMLDIRKSSAPDVAGDAT